jgi:hypothetical protein
LGLNLGWSATAALDMMEETPRTTLRDTDPSTLMGVLRLRPVIGSS